MQTIKLAAILASYVLLTCAGAILLGDATTYALKAADPNTGRAKGCYTILDELFGLGPSEGGILTGSRLVEIALGLPIFILGPIFFIHKLWRSPFEVPLVALVAAYGVWLSGKAFFWRFHDTNVYLTWRIIGYTPNDTAARWIASGVLVINVVIVTVLARRATPGGALRLTVYFALSAYLIAVALYALEFPGVVTLLLVAVPLLLAPALAMTRITHRKSAA